jgi:hypothetical protein
MKTCTCCKTTFTVAGWRDLPLVGVQVTKDEQGTYRLEMRNCPCGSTLAIEVPVKRRFIVDVNNHQFEVDAESSANALSAAIDLYIEQLWVYGKDDPREDFFPNAVSEIKAHVVSHKEVTA